MKNKLLLSSALVGSLIAGSAAIAQTSVTGNLAIQYRAQEFKAANGLASTRGFGRESQVNFTNKGKLSNGMDYQAGFSLEFDGTNRNTDAILGGIAMTGSPENSSISNENLYIDFISGNTTVTVGVDHIQNITSDVIPQVLPVWDNVSAGIGGKATNTYGANPKEAFGVGIIQKIPAAGLSVSALYVPRNADYGTSEQTAPYSGALQSKVTDAGLPVTGSRNSAYELGLVGSDTFGVKGLGVRAFMNREEAQLTGVPNVNGSRYGVTYTAGQFAVGAEKGKQNRTANNTTSGAVDANQSTKAYGLTYAATKDVSVGVAHLRTDLSNTTLTEKITSLQVGYNLGPVAIAAAFSDIKDIGATSTTGADAKEVQIRLTTNF
jgi:hypothetical protein